MKLCSFLVFAMTRLIQPPNTRSFCRWHVGATGVAAPVAASFAETSASSLGSKAATAKTVSDFIPPLFAEYPQAFEDIERAIAPDMSDGDRVGQHLESLHGDRESEVKSASHQQLKWTTSKAINPVLKKTISSTELAFRDKQRQYAHNRFVQTMADFDLDTLQNASINYRPTPLPLEEYLKMINNVRRNRMGVQVEAVTASLPDPAVAYTPFHRDIAKQKMLEKKFRVHYLTGSGRKFPFFHNAEDDCFWKKIEDGSVACVLKEELKKKLKHDPALTVAVDQTGMYDRIEEAPFPRTPMCADFYLEKATWTYYCVPDFLDLRLPKDYKKMQRYKNQLNKYHFHQWAAEQSQTVDIPSLHRPPRPAGSPLFTADPEFGTNATNVFDTSSGDSNNKLIQEAKAYMRGNHPKANATISAVDVQYPLQEGVLIVTPHNFTVAQAPALKVIENELLVAGSKKFAQYSYDIFELIARSKLRKMQTKSTAADG